MSTSLNIVPAESPSNDFPVLKAFQEYIDAEQAKARERMLGLSVFFIVLLIVVVITFVLVLTTVINRNQALSDRLLDYALKEREQQAQVVQPIPVSPPPQQQSVAPQPSVQEILKPFLERLEREQLRMKEAYEKQQKEAEERAAKREAVRNDELQKIRNELNQERERTRRENDRQAEIERHRRRLYPEYYNIPHDYPASSQATQPRYTQPPPSQSLQKSTASKKSVSKNEIQANPQGSVKQPSLSAIKPVTYFNVDDDDGVPFLIETPSANKTTK